MYHTRFFNVCKSQKAIKQAFCFFKLVPNPTLSTFNMLMSVCASSKDSEGKSKCFSLFVWCSCLRLAWSCDYLVLIFFVLLLSKCTFRSFSSSAACPRGWTQSWLQTLHYSNNNLCQKWESWCNVWGIKTFNSVSLG